jgi:DNA sulfur modification protein DndB
MQLAGGLVSEEVITFDCFNGVSAHRPVLLGFGRADLLRRLSFADVLDEETGRGYQRRFNSQHSLDFRRYIQQKNSATIPLTFNLRPRDNDAWQLIEIDDRRVKLKIAEAAGKVLAQVDCQHRLGHLDDLQLELPFMCFIGLSEREEMEVFNVINSKAKGLSTSLLDFHDAQLSSDLALDRPELFVALFLNNDTHSPWYRQLDLGGGCTSGIKRRASLRTMQKAVKRFLNQTKILTARTPEETTQVIVEFWHAVTIVFLHAWTNPRKHLLTKGIGVYALMDVAADIYSEIDRKQNCDRRYFSAALGDFASQFDWTTEGPLKGMGGEGGVKAAVAILRDARRKARFRVVSRAK